MAIADTEKFLWKIADKLRFYFEFVVEQEVGNKVSLREFNGLQYKKRSGVDGTVYLTNYDYETNFGQHRALLAIKTSHNREGLVKGIANSSELEQKFRARPMLSTPRYLLVNWSDPFYVVFEGVHGINYDEAEHVSNRATYAGMALATVHGIQPSSVDVKTYKELASMLTMYLYKGDSDEGAMLKSLRDHTDRLRKSIGGAVIHGDFHQSNVMMNLGHDDYVQKLYIIDNEFMDQTNTHFCRFDDIGTFLGGQACREFLQTRNITRALHETAEFVGEYDATLREDSHDAVNIPMLYPEGVPMDFFAAMWTLTNIMDKLQRRPDDEKTQHEVMLQKELVGFLLRESPFSSAISSVL